MSKNKISPLGTNWNDFEKENFTPEEIAESNLRVAIISEIINTRQEQKITQKELEAMSGVKQPIIARLEKGTTDPQISTVLKVLFALGKTLKVVPIDENI